MMDIKIDKKIIKSDHITKLTYILHFVLCLLWLIFSKFYTIPKIKEAKKMYDSQSISLDSLSNIVNVTYFLGVALPGVILSLFSFYKLYTIGIKTLRMQIYPPLGINVPFRTTMKTGVKAKHKGVLLLTGSIFSLMLIAGIFFLWYWVNVKIDAL